MIITPADLVKNYSPWARKGHYYLVRSGGTRLDYNFCTQDPPAPIKMHDGQLWVVALTIY